MNSSNNNNARVGSIATSHSNSATHAVYTVNGNPVPFTPPIMASGCFPISPIHNYNNPILSGAAEKTHVSDKELGVDIAYNIGALPKNTLGDLIIQIDNCITHIYSMESLSRAGCRDIDNVIEVFDALTRKSSYPHGYSNEERAESMLEVISGLDVEKLAIRCMLFARCINRLPQGESFTREGWNKLDLIIESFYKMIGCDINDLGCEEEIPF